MLLDITTYFLQYERLMKKKSGETLKSVEKALQILEAFNISHPELSVAELEDILSLPKVSIYRFLRVLLRRGFITQNPQTRKYRLGIKVFELGSVVLRNMELRKAAFPLIEELSQRSGETVHLGILDGHEVVSIEGAESGYSLRISSPIGKRVYPHSTGIGKAILAFLQDEKIEEIIKEKGLPRFMKNTITEPEELKKELQLIQERGYAVDNEENEPGVRCVAAPILDSSHHVIASVSISGPSVRITPAKIPGLAEMVIETSQKISGALGYVPS
jgi:DNA-binding IclR family transcriptional regulator